MAEFKQVTMVHRDGRERIAHSAPQQVALKFAGFAPKTKADVQVAQENVAPFDPSEHTAAEVAAHIAAADATEAQRVRDAEVAGKNRASALA